jgi:hypothetical protein
VLKVRNSAPTGLNAGWRKAAALALTLCGMLAHLLGLPDVADAGRRRHVGSPPATGQMPVPIQEPVTVQRPVSSEVRPKSAFGSPGGFPFTESTVRRHVPCVRPGCVVFRRHVVWAAPPVALYSPSIQYTVPAETAPPVINVSPVIYTAPAVHVYQPAVAQPERVQVTAPPELPLTRVVEHPTGRYELRGDGSSAPYEWVWIPNPPSAPPEPASSVAAEPKAAPVRATGRTAAYRWSDDDGTIFVTNRLDQVPEAYRSRASVSAP